MLNTSFNILSNDCSTTFSKPLDLQLEKIRSVFNRGLFKAYEHDLKKALVESSDENWLHIIDKLVAYDLDPSHKQYQLVIYLFALAIDPEVSDEDKEAQFLKAIQPLNIDELDNLHYWLGRANPSICIKALKYCSDEHWQAAFKKLIEHSGVSVSLENYVYALVDTLFPCSCAPVDKQVFLNRLFKLLPESSKDVILNEILGQNRIKSTNDELKKYIEDSYQSWL